MSDTSRTDAALLTHFDESVVPADLARQLECELRKCEAGAAAMRQDVNRIERENTNDAKWAVTKRADVPPWEEVNT